MAILIFWTTTTAATTTPPSFPWLEHMFGAGKTTVDLYVSDCTFLFSFAPPTRLDILLRILNLRNSRWEPGMEAYWKDQIGGSVRKMISFPEGSGNTFVDIDFKEKKEVELEYTYQLDGPMELLDIEIMEMLAFPPSVTS